MHPVHSGAQAGLTSHREFRAIAPHPPQQGAFTENSPQTVDSGPRSEAGYRLYSAQDLQRIRFILSAKEVGFTLKEIEELLALEVTRDEKSCQDVKSLVDEKLATVTQRIHELQRIKKSLQSLSDACCGGDEPATHCTILEALSDHDAGSSLVGGKHHDLIK